MGDFEFNLDELNDRISIIFERYKEELNSQSHPNVNYLLYNINQASDGLMYKLKFEINQFLKDKSKGEASSETKNVAVNNKKTECLIKLQTLTSELTCLILEDYAKEMDKKRGRMIDM